jgi:hypothetical protein
METLTEGQIRHKREREKEIIDHQRDLYERAVRRAEWEKEQLKPKPSTLSEEDRIKAAQAVHQAKIDREKNAQVAAQATAREAAEANKRDLAKLQRQQTAPKPEEERYLCPTCGDPVTPEQAFHRKGDPTLFEYCVIDPKKALRSGKFSREELINLGFTF